MELQEHITAFETEKKHYLSIIENLNNEKISLDQMLVDSIKQALVYKKESITKDSRINALVNQVTQLEKSIGEVTRQREQLQNGLAIMQSDSSPGG